MTYDSGMALAKERENFKAQINDLQIQVAQLQVKLESAENQNAALIESLTEERKQVDIIKTTNNKVIAELEGKLQLKDDKINLMEINSKLKDQQIADLKEMYKNKSPGLEEKLKWGAGGTVFGAVAILGLLAGIGE